MPTTAKWKEGIGEVRYGNPSERTIAEERRLRSVLFILVRSINFVAPIFVSASSAQSVLICRQIASIDARSMDKIANEVTLRQSKKKKNSSSGKRTVEYNYFFDRH